jgi:eukaryotic-like serine/threonine-protein kinase
MRAVDINSVKLVFMNREITDLPPGVATEENLSVIKCRSNRVTITPTMKRILLKASEPHTVRELANWLAEENDLSPEHVYPAVQTFAARMVKLGVLSPESFSEDKRDAIASGLESEKQFGPFTLQTKVARNSKAILFTCTKKNSNTTYLIKILIDPGECDSISREFQILRALPDHPNVRRSIETSVIDGHPYLLLEYIDGISLSKQVNEISLITKLIVGRKILKGLAHLHNHKVLHGDIHTSNFIFSPPDNIHLVDLGMAYYEHETNANHGGVANYMPPERMPDHTLRFSNKLGDYVSEIFQVGICLYHLLAGDYPFQGVLLKQLAHAIKYEPPKPLTATFYDEVIPQSMSLVVFRALEKKPADRYQRVDDMLTDWNKAIKQYMKISPVSY